MLYFAKMKSIAVKKKTFHVQRRRETVSINKHNCGRYDYNTTLIKREKDLISFFENRMVCLLEKLIRHCIFVISLLSTFGKRYDPTFE